MLPFSYAVRNLLRSKTRLLQTVGGSALVVLLVMAAAAINEGMTRVLSASGSPHNVILVGAGSEESIQRSEVAENSAGIAEAAISGITERLQTRAISSEIHYMNRVELEGGQNSQALLRGITPEAMQVHSQVRLLEGSFPASGQVMVGRLAWRKLRVSPETLKPGRQITLDGQQLLISGTFAAPGTVMESELWAPLNDLRVLAKRDTLSCVILRLDDPGDFPEVELFTKQRLDLELTALRENDYYAQLTAFFRPLRVMTWLTAGLIATGALFGGINTLYAAFASRVRELAALQAIGFSRGTLLLSLIQECVLACLIGSLLASAMALLLLEGHTVPFSIGAFVLEISPQIAVLGIVTGLLLGLIGAIPPAIRCLKPALASALRAS